MNNFFKRMHLKDRILAAVVVIALLFIIIQNFISNNSDNSKEDVTVGIAGINMIVDVALTETERYTGLSNKESLGSVDGLLFLHKSVGRHEYVMRDMRFDLDFIFIRDGKVVDIAKGVENDFKGIIRGAVEYDRVIETSSGWVNQRNIKLGDAVDMNFKKLLDN